MEESFVKMAIPALVGQIKIQLNLLSLNLTGLDKDQSKILESSTNKINDLLNKLDKLSK